MSVAGGGLGRGRIVIVGIRVRSFPRQESLRNFLRQQLLLNGWLGSIRPTSSVRRLWLSHRPLPVIAAASILGLHK